MNPKLTYCARSRIHRLHLLPLPRRHHHDDDCVLPALWALQIRLLKNTQKALKHTHTHTECARVSVCVCVSLSFQEEFKSATTSTAKSVQSDRLSHAKSQFEECPKIRWNWRKIERPRAPPSAKRNFFPFEHEKIGGNPRLEPSGFRHIPLPARAVIPVRRVPTC
jgi:hypothetical protein